MAVNKFLFTQYKGEFMNQTTDSKTEQNFSPIKTPMTKGKEEEKNRDQNKTKENRDQKDQKDHSIDKDGRPEKKQSR
jgi:hypothetical protein